MAESKSKRPETGMWECEITNPSERSSYKKGDKVIYHASTASALEQKGVLKIVKDVSKDYMGKGMKK